MSYLDIVDHTSLFEVLHAVDEEVAKRLKAKRCPRPGCGGPLHWDLFERKPRGGPIEVPEEYCHRLGLCCGWCRKRVLPPSCLFWGRRVYWGAVVILVTAAVRGLEKRSASELCRHFGGSRRTIRRWVRYFETAFPSGGRWQWLRGRVAAVVRDDDLPGSLLEWFSSTRRSAFDAVVRCLCFLAGTAGRCGDLLETRGIK
jgi:hypothetical protein